MSVIDFAEYLKTAVTAGSAVEGTAVKVIADNGAEIGDAVFKVINGGNGTAEQVGIATQSAAGGGLVATGMAYLALPVTTVGLAVGAAFGIAAGGGMYALAPEFWTNVANALMSGGQTIGGKVLCYWDGEKMYVDESTLEIFKTALINEGAFDGGTEWDEHVPSGSLWELYAPINSTNVSQSYLITTGGLHIVYHGFRVGRATVTSYGTPYQCTVFTNNEDCPSDLKVTSGIDSDGAYCIIFSSKVSSPFIARVTFVDSEGSVRMASAQSRSPSDFTYDNKTVYYHLVRYDPEEYSTLSVSNTLGTDARDFATESAIMETAWLMQYGTFSPTNGIQLQEDAIFPDAQTSIADTYIGWNPYEYDPTLPDPAELPTVRPIKYPGTEPDPYPDQEGAQNPDAESVPDSINEIMPAFPIPDPIVEPVVPVPEPLPDPDPEPDPDPLPEDEPVESEEDPIDPNDPVPPSPIIPPPTLPTTVDSSKLFTVYNPTSSQLDALGGYLWDASIIAAIRDIWQDPMDALISLQQVFVTPPTSGSHNIILGFLDSGVNSAVVSTQFVTVDCGTVTVAEKRKNATDYAPYTSLHLYLPFIGIVELDTNECMNADISVKYKVDVYTGTCLAQVSIDRDPDMPNDPILYTFSGNCSQQLPLTSGNATGLLNALMGAVTAGLSAASGGGLSTLAGAQLLGNSLTHEMMHVSHSGNISANAGIMGQKKPYLIIGRRHPYDANDYNKYYGYPANKTVILNNHPGFCRVKKAWIKTSALQDEYNQIMELLEDGVFI